MFQAQLARLTVPILVDQAALATGLGGARGQLNLFANSVAGIFQGMGQSIFGTLTAAITAPFKLIGRTISDAINAETVNLKFRSVFKELTDEAEAWAKSFGARVGMAVGEVKNVLARYQDTLVPIGFDRATAAEISKKLTALATDLSASEGISQAESADRIVSGMVGNHEALRRFGVIITETSLSAQLMASGMAKSTRDATELQKVIARLNILLEGTRDAQGASARAAGSLMQESRALWGVLTGLSASIGQLFTPALAEVTGFFKELASQMNASLGDTESIGKSIGTAAGTFLKKFEGMRDGILALFEDISQALIDLLQWMADALGSYSSLSDFLVDAKDKLVATAEEIGHIMGKAMGEAMRSELARQANQTRINAVTGAMEWLVNNNPLMPGGGFAIEPKPKGGGAASGGTIPIAKPMFGSPPRPPDRSAAGGDDFSLIADQKDFWRTMTDVGEMINKGFNTAEDRAKRGSALFDSLPAARKPGFQFMDSASVQSNIQSALGRNDAAERDKQRNKVLEKINEEAIKTVEALTGMADSIGDSISKYLGFTD